MRTISLLIVSLSFLSLTACELHQIKGEVGGVEVEATTKAGHYDNKAVNSGSFCPPGQAKKGNC